MPLITGQWSSVLGAGGDFQERRDPQGKIQLGAGEGIRVQLVGIRSIVYLISEVGKTLAPGSVKELMK